MRNFLSVGAVTQAISFDTKELTLVLGENLDLGSSGARNGVGKTTMIQALTYALFGNSINQIRKDNLINRTNGKKMLVTLEFSSNGTEYKIERGRKPNILKFYVNNNLQESKDDAQGENKETQIEIERAIGMSFDMFKHIVALNTYSQPFLSLPSGDQRKIIEQLLGITLLSEKAEVLKEQMRVNKETIQQEEFKVKAIEEANKRVQEQINALKRRQNLWQKQHEDTLNKLIADFDELNKINIEVELKAHKDLVEYNHTKRLYDQQQATIARITAWQQRRDGDIAALNAKYETLSHIDIEAELLAHKLVACYNLDKIQHDSIKKAIAAYETTLKREQLQATKLKDEIKTLEENKCYACGQDFHDENHNAVINNKRALLVKTENEITQTQNKLEKYKNMIMDLGEKPTTYYATEAEAVKHSSELERIQQQIEAKKNEENPFTDQLSTTEIVVPPMPVTIYDTEAEAIEHRAIVDNLAKSIESKVAEVDPYHEQIIEMEKLALQEISFETINELTKHGEHLKFLHDLLTSKDSFVRKKIIDQNLSYLNTRLTNYLDKIGLPHTVVFKNDLSVEITELGRELDFYNLSRGEMNRLILALSFAFRDVWESLYRPINTIFIDELIDSGMDTIGVENSMAILKDMSRRRQKSIWLVSHREELAGRVPQVLKVIKENGFTSFQNSVDIE